MGELSKDGDEYEWHGWRKEDGTPFSLDTLIFNNITLKPYYTKKGPQQ